ncbi:hypothetical protein [Streptomyces djakartensis]|uniref:hypothetical protein n=1 Tax=Streptomyces djakartensis TaxID=68193 RepID=UPI0034DFA94E
MTALAPTSGPTGGLVGALARTHRTALVLILVALSAAAAALLRLHALADPARGGPRGRAVC